MHCPRASRKVLCGSRIRLRLYKCQRNKIKNRIPPVLLLVSGKWYAGYQDCQIWTIPQPRYNALSQSQGIFPQIYWCSGISCDQMFWSLRSRWWLRSLTRRQLRGRGISFWTKRIMRLDNYLLLWSSQVYARRWLKILRSSRRWRRQDQQGLVLSSKTLGFMFTSLGRARRHRSSDVQLSREERCGQHQP